MKGKREIELDKVEGSATWRGRPWPKDVDALIAVEGRGTNAIPGMKCS